MNRLTYGFADGGDARDGNRGIHTETKNRRWDLLVS